MALDLELLKKEYQEAVAQQMQEEYWVPEMGESLIRILPPVDGKLFYRKVGIHYRLAGSGMEFCPKLTAGDQYQIGEVVDDRCPICEVVEELRKSKSPAAVQLVNRLAVVERYLMNIIPLSEDQKRVRQYIAPKTVRLALLKIILDPDYGDITDLERGRNVVIEKIQGGGGFVNYSVRVKPREISVRELLGRELTLNEIPNLNDFVMKKIKSYDRLKVVLYGGEQELAMEELMERYSDSSKADFSKKEYDAEVSVSKRGVNTSADSENRMSIDEMMKIAQSVVSQLKRE
jgi:hypothetical protein